MAKSGEESTPESPWCAQISFSVLTVMFASLTLPISVASMVGDTPPPENLKSPGRAAALHSATKTATMGFLPSLEMKENVDFLLMPALLVQERMSDEQVAMVRLDATVELNAPLSRTYVVLFVRHWASLDSYGLGVVWAEPHTGSLNFPIYPPTLNVISDRNQFAIGHQLQHTYDGMFAKPLGQRGPFKHRFNTYYMSDIRFAERETLDLRIRASDIRPLVDANGDCGERVLDMVYPQSTAPRKGYLAKMTVRATGPRVDGVTLMDSDGQLLKNVQYEYGGQEDAKRLTRQTMRLPERSTTVAFAGEGPTITIGGEKRRYSQLEIMDPPGGRKCIVDYQPVQLRGHAVDLPSRIEVNTGDGKQLLRCARMYNVTACEETPEQVTKSAEQFSFLDPNETRCRELMIKYWLKRRSEMARDDVETLERLRKHFGEESSTSITVGEQLKRMNMLLQVGWMLDDPNGLEESFREYTRLLRSNGLGRMVLFGGENLIETTARWGQPDTADKLLSIWLDASVSENDMATMLDFASARLAKGSLWTTAKLLERAPEHFRLPADQRFAAEALRCTALSRIAEMVQNPNGIKSDVDIARARWVLWGTTQERLHEELRVSIAAAQRSFDAIERPTRQDRALKRKLDGVEENSPGDRSVGQ